MSPSPQPNANSVALAEQPMVYISGEWIPIAETQQVSLTNATTQLGRLIDVCMRSEGTVMPATLRLSAIAPSLFYCSGMPVHPADWTAALLDLQRQGRVRIATMEQKQWDYPGPGYTTRFKVDYLFQVLSAASPKPSTSP
jgi:hypothetical protein